MARSLSDNALGALFMALSMAGFACNDAVMKATFGDLPLFQAIFLRGLFASAFVAAFAAGSGALRFRPSRADMGPISLRAFGEIGSTACFLSALQAMPIANATAILQLAPLAVTLGAALFLGEKVGWRRGLAIAAGFLGVMVMVRPGAAGFEPASLLAVVAVGFIALRDLSTRRLTRATPSLYASLVAALAITAFAGLLSLAIDWRPVSGLSWARLAGAAGFLMVGYVFGVMTMRVGEIGAIAPVRYTVLLWALVLGWAVFGDVPDFWTLAGAAIVVAAGVFALRRERARALGSGTGDAPATPPPPRWRG